ncbi:hypothetical protein G7092_26525 [Mucilaginibacter sp. HC2]|uniref:hypothetical protein n=1 Tax=Mucilaginibacter inviolabilis TaxID=2714892 RepID=UPI00140C71E2|nr:hypothetical protein [Mucilaginibacter inviolabilis]NHA07383.1 hypothetical protein [Mucilaginibacter inviolabilis]
MARSTTTSSQPANLSNILIVKNIKGDFIHWYNGDYPSSYKNQLPKLQEKVVKIANRSQHGSLEARSAELSILAGDIFSGVFS